MPNIENYWRSHSYDFTQGIRIEYEKINQMTLKQIEADRKKQAQRKIEREKNKKVFKTRKVKGGYEVVQHIKKPKMVIVLTEVETLEEASKLKERLDNRFNSGYYGNFINGINDWQEMTFTVDRAFMVAD